MPASSPSSLLSRQIGLHFVSVDEPMLDESPAFLRGVSELHRISRIAFLHHHAFKELTMKPFVG